MRRFGNILYVERCPTGSARGLCCAAEVARMYDARLTVAGLAPPPPAGDPHSLAPGAAERREAAVRRWRGRLDDLARRARLAGLPVETRVLDGSPDAVCREVTRGNHDLAMKVSGCDREWRLRRLAPEDRSLLRRCPCPVWILDPAQSGTPAVVLAVVDVEGEEARLAERVVALAGSLAERAGAELRVVHPWSVPGESILASPLRGVSRGRLRSIRARTRREHRLRVQRLLEREAPRRPAAVTMTKGSALPAVRNEARRVEADVAVVANACRTGARAWLFGNLAEGLVGRFPGAVLAVGEGAGPEGDGAPGERKAGFELTAGGGVGA